MMAREVDGAAAAAAGDGGSEASSCAGGEAGGDGTPFNQEGMENMALRGDDVDEECSEEARQQSA